MLKGVAWYYRLQQVPQKDQAGGRGVNWRAAIPLSLVTGAVFAILSLRFFDLPDDMPFLVLMWAPIGACLIVAFLTIAGGGSWKQALLVIGGLVGLGVYVTLFVALANRGQYRDLMAIHLPLLALIGVGLSIVGIRSDAQSRFAFLIKSIEVIVTGGLYVLAGGIFALITEGLFSALGIQLYTDVWRLLIMGGGGLIIVWAVASVYDPRVGPLAQRFEQGPAKLIPALTRLLLPLTLLVLVVYLFVIPFNFMAPFRNREVLIIYNVMLFAVMGLLVGATPVNETDLPPKYHAVLRTGILAVASLTVLVSLYALSATIYRTSLGGITVNRLTVIGWNSINIAILGLLIYKQFKHGQAVWVRSAQVAYSAGAVGYAIWTLFLIVAIPVLFR